MADEDWEYELPRDVLTLVWESAEGSPTQVSSSVDTACADCGWTMVGRWEPRMVLPRDFL